MPQRVMGDRTNATNVPLNPRIRQSDKRPKVAFQPIEHSPENNENNGYDPYDLRTPDQIPPY